MALWTNTDAANGAPLQADTTGYGGNTPQVTANGDAYYGNTQISAFVENAALGIFGVSTNEQSNTSTGDGGTGVPPHAGWIIRKVGTGPIKSITANAGGHFVNAYINFSGGGGKACSGQVHANAEIVINSEGDVKEVILGNTAGIYANTPVIENVYTSCHFTANTDTLDGKVDETRANAVFTITMGGRANRVQTETVVAMGSMVGDGSNAVFNLGDV